MSPGNCQSSSMNLAKLQDTKLIYRNLLHFCTLTMIYQERKLGNHTIYNHVKRNKIPRIKLRTKKRKTNIWYHFWSELKVSQSCLTLCDPMDCTREFSRPEHWSGKQFPSQGDLPNPGREPWEAVPFSRRSSNPGREPAMQVALPATREAHHFCVDSKKNTDELVYKTETDSQTKKTKLWLPKGKQEGIN